MSDAPHTGSSDDTTPNDDTTPGGAAPSNAEAVPTDAAHVRESAEEAERLERHNEPAADDAGMRRDDLPPRTAPPGAEIEPETDPDTGNDEGTPRAR